MNASRFDYDSSELTSMKLSVNGLAKLLNIWKWKIKPFTAQKSLLTTGFTKATLLNGQKFAYGVIVRNLSSLSNKSDFLEKYADELIEAANKSLQTSADDAMVEMEGGSASVSSSDLTTSGERNVET